MLDLACGSGEFCAVAMDAGARATGIDISHAMIELARQASNAEFHVRALGHLPWEDGRFDVVTAFNALFFAADPEGAFAEPGTRRRVELPEPQVKLTIDIPQEHPDEDTMLRTFLSVGRYQRLIESEGEESVAEKIKAVAEPHRTADGGYRFANKYLMSIFRKNEIPRKRNQAAARIS
ncbi:class I SAM-dependent methyltransferase [Lentzea sp. PSKA42]|uniref:Class I SAM-dependent methyltransferase n=1 Tax=Lentzea indica TaxID=2604800 RepID=A0ABX1FMD8_9PSEU|nr:class I SAM-dependent methyltransferase [Lentzea indica]NKE59930.1 class I SAM-dependent methyltransferase [Lentzea indica]